MSTLLTGTCGAEVRWHFNQESGELTICGTGPMTDYFSETETPWYDYQEKIKKLLVEEGVTTLSDYGFAGCSNMKEIVLPSTMEILGTYSLRDCAALTEVKVPEGVRLIGAKVFSVCAGLKKIYLPLSLKAVDMKAFEKTTELKEVVYAGNSSQWNQIRISGNACGNKTLLNADFTYLGEDEDDVQNVEEENRNRIPVYEYTRKLLEQGGDGRLHILAVDLKTPDIPGKQGDCALLIFPDGQTMMIDAGVPYCEERMMDAMHNLGLTSLDYFVISHPHLDHVGNALKVAKYIYEQGGTIGTYFYMGYQFRDLEPALSAYLEEQGVVMDNHLRAGDVRQIGEVKMEVLGPSAEKTAQSFTAEHINSLSLMLKFSFGKASYLTCGDLYRSDELEAIQNYGDALKVTAAKANHHGAYTSDCPEWLEATYPELMIVHTDDIGATLLAERAERMGIEYYTVGLDGAVLTTLYRDGSVEAQTSCGKTFCKKSAE